MDNRLKDTMPKCEGCIAKDKMFEKITSQVESVCAMVAFLQKKDIKIIKTWCEHLLKVKKYLLK